MATYDLVTHWRIPGRAEDVFAVLDDTASYSRWWSKVFLHTVVWTEPGTGDRMGRIHSRGWLPYTLKWQGRQRRHEPPRLLEMDVTGDFDGTGRWELTQEGEVVAVHFQWTILANKPLLRYLSFLLRPIFQANHDWAMRQGHAALLAELARRASLPKSGPGESRPPPRLRSVPTRAAGT